MEIRFTLQLPRDALSVPVVRRVLASSMQTLGVARGDVEDIEVALTEACTNVLDHAAGDDEYEVVAGIDGHRCTIQIVDRGAGFDPAAHGNADADPDAEEGRGIQLMRALVDRVHFRTAEQSGRETSGTVVHMEKSLTFAEGSPIEQLAGRTSAQTEVDLTRSEETLRESAAALIDPAGPAA